LHTEDLKIDAASVDALDLGCMLLAVSFTYFVGEWIIIFVFALLFFRRFDFGMLSETYDEEDDILSEDELLEELVMARKKNLTVLDEQLGIFTDAPLNENQLILKQWAKKKLIPVENPEVAGNYYTRVSSAYQKFKADNPTIRSVWREFEFEEEMEAIGYEIVSIDSLNMRLFVNCVWDEFQYGAAPKEETEVKKKRGTRVSTTR
jgi:hypothetical protein